MTREQMIELLADAEHAGWAHWMTYLFSVCKQSPDGSVTIPARLVERWKRQAETPYADLTELEKQSDRNQVEHILPIIDTYAKIAERKEQ